MKWKQGVQARQQPTYSSVSFRSRCGDPSLRFRCLSLVNEMLAKGEWRQLRSQTTGAYQLGIIVGIIYTNDDADPIWDSTLICPSETMTRQNDKNLCRKWLPACNSDLKQCISGTFHHHNKYNRRLLLSWTSVCVNIINSLRVPPRLVM